MAMPMQIAATRTSIPIRLCAKTARAVLRAFLTFIVYPLSNVLQYEPLKAPGCHSRLNATAMESRDGFLRSYVMKACAFALTRHPSHRRRNAAATRAARVQLLKARCGDISRMQPLRRRLRFFMYGD
jgi:hypothetical protein